MMRAQQHPTGLAALGSTALILLGRRLGVELSADEAAVIVGLVSVAVSAFTPRRV